MATFTINFTDSSKTPIAVPPGAVDGPNGVFAGRSTDIDLYGDGAQQWGLHVDEDLLHILENFACPNDLHDIYQIDDSTHFKILGDVRKSFSSRAVLEINSLQITAISLAGGSNVNYFQIPGNFTADFLAGGSFNVSGSAAGTYTVAPGGSSLIGTNTVIPVTEVIPTNGPVLGSISAGNYVKLSGNLVTVFTPGYTFSLYDGVHYETYTVTGSEYAAPNTFVHVSASITPTFTAGTGLTAVNIITRFQITEAIDATFIASPAGTSSSDMTVSVITTGAIQIGQELVFDGQSGSVFVSNYVGSLITLSSSQTWVDNVSVTAKSLNNQTYGANPAGLIFDGTYTIVQTIETLPNTTPTTLGKAGNENRPNQTLPRSPITPIQGQLWYNSSSNVLYAYNGIEWATANVGAGTAASISTSQGLSASGAPLTTSGNISLSLSSQLQNFHSLTTSGLVTRKGDGSIVARTLTSTGNTITITNPVGDGGNPNLEVTAGNLEEAVSSILTISGGTGSVVGSGTTIEVRRATASQDGYLAASDFAAFQAASGSVGSVTFPLTEPNGGTSLGSATIIGNGKILIGNANKYPSNPTAASKSGFSLANLTAGSGISVSNGYGSITITAKVGDYISSVGATADTISVRDSAGFLWANTQAGYQAAQLVNKSYLLDYAIGGVSTTVNGSPKVWHNLTGSRGFGSVYQNYHTAPIHVCVSFYQSNATLQVSGTGSSGPWITVGWHGLPSTSWATCSAIVPAGHWYRAVNGGSCTITGWAELY